MRQFTGTMPDGTRVLITDYGDGGPAELATRPDDHATWSAPTALEPVR